MDLNYNHVKNEPSLIKDCRPICYEDIVVLNRLEIKC